MDIKDFIAFLSTGVQALLSEFTTDEPELKDSSIADTMATFGFKYGSVQDIFYSRYYAWQRFVGYCRLYDEASGPMSMVIDCEPIYFEYAGKRWMIEFWKGQYGVTSGAEVGVYYTDRSDLKIPGVFSGTFYNCVRDEDMLDMSFSLMKKGQRLFRRSAKHWWLTGFKLGEFSQPSELAMNISITLKDDAMTRAFLGGLLRAGYTRADYQIEGNTVTLLFDKPHTPQPYTRLRSLGIEGMAQLRNKTLCDMFMNLTKGSTSMERLTSLQQKDKNLFNRAVNIGKPKNVYAMYTALNKYLALPADKS
jgi:hypothetical protein